MWSQRSLRQVGGFEVRRSGAGPDFVHVREESCEIGQVPNRGRGVLALAQQLVVVLDRRGLLLGVPLAPTASPSGPPLASCTLRPGCRRRRTP